MAVDAERSLFPGKAWDAAWVDDWMIAKQAPP
jgi:hypothetical protein